MNSSKNKLNSSNNKLNRKKKKIANFLNQCQAQPQSLYLSWEKSNFVCIIVSHIQVK